MRYNTVGRPELRELLLPVRTSSQPAATALPEGLGQDPATLPHKWMALLRSTDVLPAGPDRLVVAAGDPWNIRPQLHDGVAVLSSRELLVATDPTPDAQMAHYGHDLRDPDSPTLPGADRRRIEYALDGEAVGEVR